MNVLPKVNAGTLERLPNFQSRHIPARHVDIWLPDEYDPARPHPVLYMHDGQMLYDASITWNGQAWGIADIASELIRTGKIPPLIVVGIWNAGESRHSEYFPQKPFEALPLAHQKYLIEEAKRQDDVALFVGELRADAYLKFLTEELKPFIDQNFATAPERDATFIAGSSMGGLISIYALCEYPAVFGGAACLSTHWTGTHTSKENPVPTAFQRYLAATLPNAGAHRLYFDYGTETLDALYEPHQIRVDKIVREKGYTESDWQTLKFEGAEHSEDAWQARLHLPLIFLSNVQT